MPSKIAKVIKRENSVATSGSDTDTSKASSNKSTKPKIKRWSCVYCYDFADKGKCKRLKDGKCRFKPEDHITEAEAKERAKGVEAPKPDAKAKAKGKAKANGKAKKKRSGAVAIGDEQSELDTEYENAGLDSSGEEDEGEETEGEE